MERRRGWIARTLDAVQGRFRRARPGSVLIMVVSLLVLLALIGTAALSTSRLDRVSSQQHVRNQQVAILADGLKEMVAGNFSLDLTDNATDSAITNPDDSSATPRDAMIGSRVPERMMRVLVTPQGPRHDPLDPTPGMQRPDQTQYVWESPSYPPVRNGLNGVPYRLDLPDEPTDKPDLATQNYYYLPLPKPRFYPTTKTLKDGKTYPALLAIDLFGAPQRTIDQPMPDGSVQQIPLRIGDDTKGGFLAADADGDGIADSLLFKLPTAPLQGITYYGAVRVVDNAAALNVNTAWNPVNEVGYVKVKSAANPQVWANGWNNGQPISLAGVWPSSIDLEGLLDPTALAITYNPAEPSLTEMAQLNGQRVWGDRRQGPGHAVNAALFQPKMPPTNASTKSAMNPIIDGYYPPYNPNNPDPTNPNLTANYQFAQMVQRLDYLFLTPGDALYNQLGRRLDFPGVVSPNTNSPDPKNPANWDFWGRGVRPLSVGDAVALAYRFTIMNPDAHDSTIEKILFTSTAGTDPTKVNVKAGRYEPAGTPAQAQAVIDQWFQNNFDYPWFVPTAQPLAGQGAPYDLPDNYPAKPMPLRALLTTLNPVRNDVYRHPTPDNNGAAGGLQTFRYIARDATRDTAAYFNQLVAANLSFLITPPSRPSKTNINTAPFGELWRGFFDVMAQKGDAGQTVTPFDFGADDPIYQGSRFRHDLATYDSIYTEQHAARMFRSPLRPNGGAVPGATPLDPPVNNPDVMRMHPFQVMALRSALAAVNAMALRTDLDVKDPADPTRYVIRDFNIPFQDILLPQVNSTFGYGPARGDGLNRFFPGLGATVYGVKRQPFITEVLLSNNVEQAPAADVPNIPPVATGRTFNQATDFNQSGFAAIEIHNPYDRPMDVSGWKLSLIDRRPIAPTSTGTTSATTRPTQTNPPEDGEPAADQNRLKVAWNNPAAPPTLSVVDLPANIPTTDPTPTPRWYPSQRSPVPPAAAFAFPANTYIPPHGYLVVSNLSPDAAANPADLDSARYVPGNANNPTGGGGGGGGGGGATDVLIPPATAPDVNAKYVAGGRTAVYCRFLHYVMDHEVVLQRPVMWDRGASGQPENYRVMRWMPVDSFDATGIAHQEYVAGQPHAVATEWHYVRGNDPNSTATRNRMWHFVYPGRYDASVDRSDQPHQQGVEVVTFNPLNNFDLWMAASAGDGTPNGRLATAPPPTPIQLGQPDLLNSRDAGQDNPLLVSTFPIQVADADFTSHFDDARLAMANNPTGGFPANPMHGFLRAGDILHTTFIGSYTIWNAGIWSAAPPNQTGNDHSLPQPPFPYDTASGQGFTTPQFIEVNPITMDAAMAEDTDPLDDRNPFDLYSAGATYKRPLEDIGRFAPININPDYQNPTAGNVPLVADVQAHYYKGTTTGADVSGAGGANGTLKFNESGSTNLHTNYPDDFWDGYEVLVFNQDPTVEPWTVQRRYVAYNRGNGFIKTVTGKDGTSTAQITVDVPFNPPLTKDKPDPNNAGNRIDRTYTFVLQRVRYGWASKLFDYFTTQQSPADDYSPNVDTSFDRAVPWGGVLDRARTAGQPYIPDPLPNPIANKNVPDPGHVINRGEPWQVDPVTGLPNQQTEDDVPSEGLININTASWRVLAQLPLVMKRIPGREQEVDHLATEYLARQIVYFRDIDDGRGFDPNDPNYFDPAQRKFKPRPHGPFKSLYELLMIPEFEACISPVDGQLLPTQNPFRDGTWGQLAYDPNITDGDFSPLRDVAANRANRFGDGVRWDWKEKYLMINRISNLVTLKSDCYTVYLQVQGWRDAGTPDATLVSQKRLAFIIDRSRISGTKRTPTIYNVPVAE